MMSDNIIFYLLVGCFTYGLIKMLKDNIRFKKISRMLNFKTRDYVKEENGVLVEWLLIYVHLDKKLIKLFNYSNNIGAFLTYEFEDRDGHIECSLIDWRLKVLRPILFKNDSKGFYKELKLSKENIFAEYMGYPIDSYLIFSKEKSFSDFEIKNEVERLIKSNYLYDSISTGKQRCELISRDYLLENVKEFVAVKNSTPLLKNEYLSEILNLYKNFKNQDGFEDFIQKNQKNINESFNKYLEKIKNKTVRDYFLRK